MGDIEARVTESLDYSFFARELQNWFLTGTLRGLDEYGVPLPLILKYENFIRQDTVDEAARRLRTMVEDKRIVGVEAAIIRNSL